MKKILAVAESMAPCVLMVDEIDKALSGLGNSGSDSGTTRRVIGSFLTWLNDRRPMCMLLQLRMIPRNCNSHARDVA